MSVGKAAYTSIGRRKRTSLRPFPRSNRNIFGVEPPNKDFSEEDMFLTIEFRTVEGILDFPICHRRKN